MVECTPMQTAVSTDRLNVFEGGGSPRIHAGEERFSAPGKEFDIDHAL